MASRSARIAALEQLAKISIARACGVDGCERCENVPAMAAARAVELGGRR